MVLPSLTTNLIIALVAGGVVAYGLVLGQDKIKTFALSTFVGIVLASTFGVSLYDLATRTGFNLGGSLTKSEVSLALFILPLLLLEFGRKQHGRHGGHRNGMSVTLILCLLTAALIISSGLQLLEPSSLERITNDSNLAYMIHQFRLWWVAAVPIAVIAESFIRPKERY